MKKLLLFSLAIGITIGAVAQNKFAVSNNKDFYKKTADRNIADADLNKPYIPFLRPNGAKKNAVITKIIGTSGNAFGLLDGTQNWLDYNPATNAVMFTHRAFGAWGGATGDLRCLFSTDWFASGTITNFTANTDSVMFLQNAVGAYRYPSGVIYNPAGNTDVNNAYAVVVGPFLVGGSAFTHSYYCSQKLDATPSTLDTNLIPFVLGSFERTNLSGGNGNLHMMNRMIDASNYYMDSALVRNGVFNTNTNTFDWGTNITVSRLFGSRVFGNAVSISDYAWNQAWATNGLDGYVFCTGIDSTMKVYSGTQVPLIWRTWDGGLTFGPIAPCSYFDRLINLTDSIWPTALSAAQYNAGTGPLEFRPFFNAGSSLDDQQLPGVVDVNGDLHMAAIIEGYSSSDVDSLDYTYTSHPTFLFDVIYDASLDSWDVRFIDQIFSAIVADDNGAAFTTNPPPNIGWEHWINVSKSPDGTCVFYTWTDTDPAFSTDNISPYIKGRAWNVVTNMATLSKNFIDPIDGGLYYYVNTADIVAKQGTTYSIPMTYVDVPGDAGGSAEAALYHYFITDATFSESEFTEVYGPSGFFFGVDTKEVNSFNVSQNYPNPANGTTSIKVTLAEASNVSVEITNMVGQSVSVVNKGRLATGSYGINLNVANLNSGIYFYTVTVGTQKVTKKMIVK